MKHAFYLLLLLTLFQPSSILKADTWDEPWQKEIIEQADYFVLARVTGVTDEGAKVHVLENFGGGNMEIDILIDNFYLLRMVSTSGQKQHLDLKKENLYYFFLKKNDAGNYSLPTPTSGYAHLDNEQYVSATYRHSYHQAVIPQDIYEFTFKNIWNYIKNKKYDKKQVNNFIDYYLSKDPAGFGDDEIEIFYHQHAAMETAYLLDIALKFKDLEKFLVSDNFHSRISALQLLGNVNSKDSKNFLVESLTDDLYTKFEKVIAIWAIKKLGDPVYIQQVRDMKDILPTERMGFGGNIMDPRVGTSFPSPKEAVEKL